jgi:hypothetical protein
MLAANVLREVALAPDDGLAKDALVVVLGHVNTQHVLLGRLERLVSDVASGTLYLATLQMYQV